MQKKLLAGAIMVGLLMIMECGKANYKDFIDVNTQFIDAMDEYTNNLDSADDADSVAEAVDRFAERMEKIAPQMKALKGKYPHWTDKTKIPDELKPLNDKAEKVAQKMPETFMKAMRHMRDPKVVAAVQRLQGAMMQMQ